MLRPIDLGNPVNRGASLNYGLQHWYRRLPNNGGSKSVFDLCRNLDLTIVDGRLTADPTAFWQPRSKECEFSSLGAGASQSDCYAKSVDGTTIDFDPVGFTLSMWVLPWNVSDYNCAIGFNSDAYGFIAYYGWYGTSLMGNGNGGFWMQSTGPYLTQYKPSFATWAITSGNGTATASMYVDGMYVGAATDVAAPNEISRIVLGTSYYSYGAQGGLGSVRIWQRCLTADEVWALYCEEVAGCPTTLNRYTPRTMVFLGGAVAAPVSATPGVASLTTTRYAPTVATPRTATPGVRSLAAARYAPTVSTPRLATIGKLSLTASLFAPAVATPRLSTPGVQSLSLTPLAPLVSTPRIVTVGVASLSAVVYAPTIATPRTSTLSVASLSLAGFAPTVATPRTATPGTVSLTVAGFAATALVPRVTTPDAADLSLTSFAPVAATPRAAVPGTAGVAITTYPPVAQTPSTATPATAALTATAFPPAVATPRTSVPGVAVLAATAFAPIVAAINPITATPSTRALSLTTYSPVASLGVIVLPGGKFRRPVASLARSFSRDALGRIFRRAAESRAFSRDGLGRKFHRSSLSRTWSYAMSANSIPVQTLTKAVGDDRYYLCDLTKAPEIVAGDTIASATISGGAGLTIGTPEVLAATTDGIAAGKGVKVQISGGTDDETASLAVVATLSGGSVIVVPVKIAVAADHE